MKNFLIASAMAVASVLSVAPQSQAASVTITTNDGAPRHGSREYRPMRVQENYRPHRPRHQDCRVKRVKSYRHGQVVIKETRVCR
jgi:hypothetical protein